MLCSQTPLSSCWAGTVGVVDDDDDDVVVVVAAAAVRVMIWRRTGEEGLLVAARSLSPPRPVIIDLDWEVSISRKRGGRVVQLGRERGGRGDKRWGVGQD